MFRYTSKLVLICLPLIIGSATAQQIDSQEQKKLYMVKFSPEYKGRVDSAISMLKSRAEFKARRKWNNAFNGFSTKLSERQVKILERLPFVEYVENIESPLKSNTTSWALNRLDETTWNVDATINLPGTANGQDIIIIDTGVSNEVYELFSVFGPRNSFGTSSVGPCNNHGTAVASAAAGRSLGVARSATIHSYRTATGSDCTHQVEDVIDAMEFLINAPIQNAVVNYSIASSYSAVRDAMRNVIRDGHLIVVAAGNNGIDMCADSTAKFSQGAIAVGSVDSSGQLSDFSNHGRCVDIYAGGESVVLSDIDRIGEEGSFNGTSFSAPYVAGIAAIYRAKYPSHTPHQVYAAIIASSSKGILTGLTSDSHNRFAYVDVEPVTSNYWTNRGLHRVSVSNISYKDVPSHECTTGDVWYEFVSFYRRNIMAAYKWVCN